MSADTINYPLRSPKTPETTRMVRKYVLSERIREDVRERKVQFMVGLNKSVKLITSRSK